MVALLLADLGLLLGLAELLHERHGLALEATLEASAGTAVNHLGELLILEFKELFDFEAAVRELVEGAGLLESLVAFLVDGHVERKPTSARVKKNRNEF